MRPSKRQANEMRTITMETGVSAHAEGSCLIQCGNTKVLCTASVEDSVPHFLRNSGKGWLTAEYGMLPRSTHTRNQREAARGKQSGRTQEIQRLIGRSLRASVDMRMLGERQIIIDCDVLEADGGTRTASITGGYVALAQACMRLQEVGVFKALPIIHPIAAISCGIYKGTPVLDLDYNEDSVADLDSNFVLTGKGDIIEIQCTAEGMPMKEEQFAALLSLAKKGISELYTKQREALGIA